MKFRATASAPAWAALALGLFLLGCGGKAEPESFRGAADAGVAPTPPAPPELPTPERMLASADVGHPVPQSAPLVRRYRDLIDRVHVAYRQGDDEVARITLRYLDMLHEKGTPGTCLEILDALARIYPERSPHRPQGEDFAEMGAVYVTTRIEMEKSHEEAIATIRAVDRALHPDDPGTPDDEPSPAPVAKAEEHPAEAMPRVEGDYMGGLNFGSASPDDAAEAEAKAAREAEQKAKDAEAVARKAQYEKAIKDSVRRQRRRRDRTEALKATGRMPAPPRQRRSP